MKVLFRYGFYILLVNKELEIMGSKIFIQKLKNSIGILLKT